MRRAATWWTALGAACVAFAVRIDGAIHFAFWQDEVASARAIAQSTPVGVAHQVARTEATPPLWYWLGWLLHSLGVPMHDVRIASALAGAALAAAVVLYARLVAPLWAAALAGLAVALGYQLVFHGRELRAYELHALFSVLLALAAVRRRPLWLGIVVALGALTNYFFLLSVVAVLLWIWTSAHMRARRRSLTLAIAAGLIPFAAWTPVLVYQYRHHRQSFIGGFRAHEVVTAYWSLFSRAPYGTAPAVVLLVAVLAGSAVLALSDLDRLCSFLAVVPYVLAALIWIAGARIFDIRNLVGVAPFGAIAVVALIALLPKPVALAAGTAMLGLLVAGYVVGNRTTPIAYDRIASSLVRAGWTPSDPIVVHGSFFASRSPLEWYLPHQPALTLGLPRSSCAHVFAVAHQHVSRRDAVRPRGRLLVAKQGHDACVRAVPESRIRAELARVP